jgi:hypothetical protein
MTKKVKIVQELIGHVVDGEVTAMPAQRSTIPDMSNPKFIRITCWTPQGLIVERGPVSVLIPFAELMKLAEVADNRLVAPPVDSKPLPVNPVA